MTEDVARTDDSDSAVSPTRVPPELAVDRAAPDRNLALELVRVTEAAAMAAGRWVGRGDKNGGDGAAVDAMRTLIGTVSMRGTVVIGEGEKDQAPMLFNGEEVGDGTGPECDVAVDPIDGTTLMAKGQPNAVAVIALAERGSMFDPSAVFYMRKIATGPEAAGVIDITAPVSVNIERVAKAKGVHNEDVTVCILDRPRHAALIEKVREAGARIRFITDGDVAGAIMAARPGTGIDLLIGTGGTPEGIIAAAALACMGGAIQAQLAPTDDAERRRALDAGHDLDRVLHTTDLVCGQDVFFCATGITDGELMRGVHYYADSVSTQSIVMRSKSGTIRVVDSIHRLDKLRAYSAIDFDRNRSVPVMPTTPDGSTVLTGRRPMLAVTTNDISGWEIQRVCGEVFGLTVRSRNAFSQFGAGLKSLVGGELRGMTKALVDSRNEVMNRMFEEARSRGGNAVIAMRFDTSEMGDLWTEICAYGTAVVAVPVTDAARQTALALGYGPAAPPPTPPGAEFGPPAGYPSVEPSSHPGQQ